MAEDSADTVTIAEAAALLGVHRNTVRNRVKAGRYRAHKVVTPQGETFAIERASLGLPPGGLHNGPHNPSHAQVHHNPSAPSQPAPAPGGLQEAQQLAVVQRLLAPFIAELSRTHAELGRTQERLVAAERDRDRLAAEVARDRGLADQLVDLLQEERDAAHRRILVLEARLNRTAAEAVPAPDPPVAAPGATGAAEPVTPHEEAGGTLRRLWGRLGRRG